MGRPKRTNVGGLVFHVLNRANARKQIFEDDHDYEAFEMILYQAIERFAMRVLAYCVMPNHWHLVVHPRNDGDLSRFTGWLTLTHTQRWHAHRESTGTGHLYQGRFKSFIVQTDAHLLAVCRYVERNPLRAGLVSRAEDWRWSSLWTRAKGSHDRRRLLSDLPAVRPEDWIRRINAAETAAELAAIRLSVNRGRPFGDSAWRQHLVDQFKLVSTVRKRGNQPRADV